MQLTLHSFYILGGIGSACDSSWQVFLPAQKGTVTQDCELCMNLLKPLKSEVSLLKLSLTKELMLQNFPDVVLGDK